MKKIVTVLLCLSMVMTMLAGCSTSGSGATAKTGLAVITSVAKSTNAGAEGDGLAQTDSLVVAVVVDKDGKILDCKMDSAQTQINFSAEGKLTTDPATEFKTKQELGNDYGMKAQSPIGKEWFEQADAFAKYCVGKTLDEVKGIAINEEGKAGDADLSASVTVHIGDFVAAVAKAVENATDQGAKAGDKLGLAISTTMGQSADATADAEGLAQAYSYYTVVTTDKDGKITSCILDGSQGNVNFSTTGVISTDITAAVQTKQELKEAYGMKKASGIGKEWYEQANAFTEYCKGKTVDEVKGIAVDAEGKVTDADLAASVTVHVAPFIANVEKAVTDATK